MSYNFSLVNPFVQNDESTFKSSVKAKNSKQAASKIYGELSKHFAYGVPKFNFTIKREASTNDIPVEEKYFHFEVSEKPKSNVDGNTTHIDYNIKGININDKAKLDAFNTKLKEFKEKLNQTGGGKKKRTKKNKKKKESESSSSSDSDSSEKLVSKYYLDNNLMYWWYDPYLYNIKSLYVPTFYPNVVPYYFEISLDIW